MENTANLKSSIAWSDFKLNSDGMVPVIAQDYQTNEARPAMTSRISIAIAAAVSS